MNQSLLQIFTSAFKSIFAQSLKEQKIFRVKLDANWRGFECVFVLTESCDNLTRQSKRWIVSLLSRSKLQADNFPEFLRQYHVFSNDSRRFPPSLSSHHSSSPLPITPHCNPPAALTQIQYLLQPLQKHTNLSRLFFFFSVVLYTCSLLDKGEFYGPSGCMWTWKVQVTDKRLLCAPQDFKGFVLGVTHGYL